MLAMMTEQPLFNDEWRFGVDELVLPLSIDQYFDAFWSDEAPYYNPGMARLPEDELIEATPWSTPSEGFEVLLNRTVI